jgi:hypothetical protein
MIRKVQFKSMLSLIKDGNNKVHQEKISISIFLAITLIGPRSRKNPKVIKL